MPHRADAVCQQGLHCPGGVPAGAALLAAGAGAAGFGSVKAAGRAGVDVGAAAAPAAGAAAGVPETRAESAAALTAMPLIGRDPSPSGGSAEPLSVTVNLSGRPTLILGSLASAGTSNLSPAFIVPRYNVLSSAS